MLDHAIFLDDNVLRMYASVCRTHCFVMDAPRGGQIDVGRHPCKTRQMEMSSGVKFGEYVYQTAGGKQSAQCLDSVF
jgi:hypothetical protein